MFRKFILWLFPLDESPERHPIQSAPNLPDHVRLRLLEENLARLWDEVWWHQLPWPRRLKYYLQGFRSPIQRFYEPKGKGVEEWQ